MGGVDKGDQMRMHRGGFASKAHFKNWYKKQFFGILDCMLLNARVAWNLAAEERSNKGKITLSRHVFLTSVAQSMLDMKDNNELGPAKKPAPSPSNILISASMKNHKPLNSNSKRKSCSVCQLEATSMNPALDWLESRRTLPFATHVAAAHTSAYNLTLTDKFISLSSSMGCLASKSCIVKWV
jgi:hypothetical protein